MVGGLSTVIATARVLDNVGWKGNQDHLGEALPRTPGENPACPTLDIRADVIDGAALRAARRPPAGENSRPPGYSKSDSVSCERVKPASWQLTRPAAIACGIARPSRKMGGTAATRCRLPVGRNVLRTERPCRPFFRARRGPSALRVLAREKCGLGVCAVGTARASAISNKQ